VECGGGAALLGEYGMIAALKSETSYSENMCDKGLTVIVTDASAIINDNNVDLLKTKQLSTRDFNPFKILIKK
jgi:hypothetical protein